MKLQISRLPLPELEFAGPGYFSEPRRGLVEGGPFDLRFGSAHRAQVRLALVGPQESIVHALEWFRRCQNRIPSRDKSLASQDFPGFGRVFRSDLVVDSSTSAAIRSSIFEKALALKPYDGFKTVVDAYSEAIRQAKRDLRPDVVVCCIPEPIERRLWSVSRFLTNVERRAIKALARSKASEQMELPFDWQPEETAEDLLRRDLRRALKAEAMRHEVPIQIGRTHLFLDKETNEEPAIRAWNSTVGLYYKAGGIPWRIRNRGPETCYAGITFHHLQTNKRRLVFSSLAQAFSSNGEGFALRGMTLEPDPERPRTPHLDESQAFQLGAKILSEYITRNGTSPHRVVLHKSSRFWREEQEGFRRAFASVPVLRLVTLAPSSIRLVTHATYPPKRGTFLTIENCRHFLFTSGFIPELATYPGPHIPIPVELVVHGAETNAETREAAMDALALGRLNWNTSDLRSSQPVTLGFARRVGGIMAEYGLFESKDPDPNYRYYM